MAIQKEPLMAIMGLVKKVDKLVTAVVAFMFIAGVCAAPFILTIVTATNIKNTNTVVVIFTALLYLLGWVMALMLMLDSAAYTYGFKRPFYSPYKRRLHLQEGTIETPLGFVLSSLVSYGLTLYGFCVLFVLLSKLDGQSFSQELDFLSSVYFTIVTAATVGYGDIVPVSKTARCFVTAEIIISFLYVIFMELDNCAAFSS